MRALKLLAVPFLTLLVLIGCQTDYDGQIIPNQKPDLAFNTYNADQMYLTKRKVRVGWHCNDQDGMKTKFYYAVSADMDVNAANALDSIPTAKWQSTDKSFADIAFPFDGDSAKSYLDPVDSTYIKYVLSRVYLYAVDEDGNKTSVISREYWRTNTKPDRPRVECPAFMWDAEHLPPVTSFRFKNYQVTTLPRVFLREQTSFWNPVLFRWTSEDADSDISDKVILQFKWELHKLNYNEVMTDSMMLDSAFVCNQPSTMVTSSGDWNSELSSVYMDEEVFNAGEGYFKLIVRVKDDGNEESLAPTTCVFEAFRPVFGKGILLYNTTALTKDAYQIGGPNASNLFGNPDKEATKTFYKNLMTTCGFSETSADPLKQFEYYDGDAVPNLKKLSQYRLVISVDDDRKNKADAFYDDKETYFGAQIREYLNMGGKIMVAGVNRFYDAGGTAYAVPDKKTALKSLLRDYFGLAAVTTGEAYQEQKGNEFRNYDFIGLTVFDHVQDSLKTMTVDSTIINDYWRKAITNKYYVVKGNGIFLPGVPTIKAQNGEIIFGYKSIYNQTSLDPTGDLRVAGGWMTGVEDPATIHPVLNRNDYDGLQPGVNSAVGTRYIPLSNAFRTAYIGVPLFFMDNTTGVVDYNIKKMIKWFDLTQVPQSVVSGKK